MKWKNVIAIAVAGLLFVRSRRNTGVMLSKNFSLDEFIRSETANMKGISNIPNPSELANISALVQNVLQPARDALKTPIYINSGFRSEKLNDAVGGAPNSQHMAKNGAAADIRSNDNLKLFNYIKDNLPFDQLIWEEGTSEPKWVHVSYKNFFNRKEVLRYNNGIYTKI